MFLGLGLSAGLYYAHRRVLAPWNVSEFDKVGCLISSILSGLLIDVAVGQYFNVLFSAGLGGSMFTGFCLLIWNTSDQKYYDNWRQQITHI